MTAGAEKAEPPAIATRWRLLSHINDEFALIQLIVLAMIIGAVAVPSFLSPANLVNILQQSSELSVLVLAEAIILIVGKFDLSLELIVGIAPMFAAWLVTSVALNGSGLMINPYLAVAVIFIVGIVIGWFNGLAHCLPRVKRFHRDARDAHPTARRNHRDDQRANPL